MSKSQKSFENLKPEQVIELRKKNLLNKFHFTSLIKKVLLIALILYITFNYVFGIMVMPNKDMTPRISPSDLLIYYRLDKEYIANDIVIVNKNGKDSVFRIVAVAGNEVSITEDGLMINGAYQSNQDIYFKTGVYEEGIKFPITLKEDEVFVLGDLREGAMDSRYFGPIKLGDIKGKVFVLLRRTQF